ncbi:MAG TPA: RNA ligase family protein [Smithellaceae bacterium]|nr:RNA ligase family protein [Smithellaceae bacterium]
MFVDVSRISYPDLTTIINQYPNPHILLGKEIVFQEKRDGSNLRIYLNENGDVVCGSRHMDVASEQFQNYLKMTPEYESVGELLRDAENWKDTYVVFGELLIKGKSPTKIEFHEDHSFVVFDIWSVKTGGFFNYTKTYQECYHNKLPVVGLYGTCNVNTLEDLLNVKEQMLQKSLDNNREGVVGKHVKGSDYIYFKEKNDTPRYEKVVRVETSGAIILPPLPDSEVTGSVEKTFADLGEDFFNIKLAMPKLAEYVGEECKKHNCSQPEKKLIVYYRERVEDLRLAGEKK